MENAIKDRFIFTYESGVTGSFLVASTNKNESIVEFQVNMLSKNPNKYILPLDVRRNNDRINIYYNITSKLSLSQYLKRNRLSKNEFIGIFSGIVKTLLNSKSFLLSDKSFLLDEEYIYISPDTMCISLVYLPFKLDIDITKALKDFAMNFVVYSANIYEEDSDSFLQQVLSFLKKDTFNILDFDRFLKEIKRSTAPETEIELQKPSGITEDRQVRVQVEKQPLKEEMVKQNGPKIEIPKPKSVADKDAKRGLNVNNNAVNGEGKKFEGLLADQNILKSFGSSPNIVIGAVIQAVLLIAVLVLFLTGTLDRLGNDKVSTVFGLLLICGAVSYFMWKKVLEIKFTENKVVENASDKNRTEKSKTGSKVNMPPVIKPTRTPKFNDPDATGPRELKKVVLPENRGMNRIDTIHNAYSENPQQEKNREGAGEIKHADEPVMINSNVNETVYLGSAIINNPHLKVFKDGIMEEVVINKPSFIIGRLDGQVDYVHSNNAIGKMHAEIITRAGCYYLKDLNSKNGTYINGKRLESNKEYEIRNNDKITLANSEFIFIVL